MKSINVFTDGGSRGNPGQAASGIYITDENNLQIHAFGVRLGTATNNVAEYTAIILAYDWLIENKPRLEKVSQISFYMDSNLVYSQLKGLFKLKNPQMRTLYLKIKEKEKQLGLPFSYSYIPRGKNKDADRYVNLALDGLI